MKRKLEVCNIFVTFKTFIENLFNCKIKMLKSDGGKEFDQTSMHAYFLNMVFIFENLTLIHKLNMELLNRSIGIS